MRWAAIAVLALAGCGAEKRADRPRPTPTPTAKPAPGFPETRVVAFYGNPADRQLGILGIGSPELAVRRLRRQARPYERKTRPVQLAFELITTVANADAGMDGMYRRRERNGIIRRYHKAARKAGALLILDVQPGRADFFTEVTHLEPWLREPDVHLALDPEWRVLPGQVPGDVIGSVDAREVNAVSAWLDQLIERHRLPSKLMVIHQFTNDMIGGRERLQTRERVEIVLNADGFGGREVKRAKYHDFTRAPADFHSGFKLFYEEDVNLMKPSQVLRLKPPPDFVVYE